MLGIVLVTGATASVGRMMNNTNFPSHNLPGSFVIVVLHSRMYQREHEL